MSEGAAGRTLEPYEVAALDDPYDAYCELRDNHPVYRSEAGGYWALSRYEDVRAAVGDAATFSSAQGITLDPIVVELTPPMLVTLDPPRHDDLRKLVSRAFTPRRIAELEEYVRTIARQLLDPAAREPEADLAADYAMPLPAIVIADLLGVPREDRVTFGGWAREIIRAGADPALLEEAMAPLAELYAYLERAIDERTREPRDDLISGLTQAELDGERLTVDEQLGFCFLLLMAGVETTTNLIGNAADLLARHPDERRALVRQPDRIPSALEEALRFESPVPGMFRTLARDVELHGTTMPSGEKVLLLFGAANRDDRAFPSPGRFDPSRGAEGHLAFGYGVHFCLGASLARLQARIAFEELLSLAPQYAVLDGAIRTRSPIVRGFSSLPVALDGGP